VAFAVVLFASDDEGRRKGTNTLVGRARQNVILELGYFIGLLGRPNACALHRGDIEIPSDYLGVLFIPMNRTDAWKLQLAKEMKAAAVELDMNLVL
jgi:predicted nucleotide-binding protein